jgi:glutamine amidotransferase
VSPKVVLLDYGSGNIRSGERALQRVGADVTVTADFDTAMNADGLLVPGVGAYEACMAGLRAVRGDVLVDRRLAASRPVLGICVGMQILFARGIEHGVESEGCAQWPGVVERLAPAGEEPVPHMGLEHGGTATGQRPVRRARQGAVLLRALLRCPRVGTDRRPRLGRRPLVTWTSYGGDRFVAAVENGPLTATQFHPEKSGDAGAALLANWLRTL